MLRGYARKLVLDERGGATVFALLWFMLLVGICGLAVDITDGFRAQTMLQATADSAALAGAIELPEEAEAINTAVAYSAQNLAVEDYGHVLPSSNVEIGAWDMDTHIFDSTSLVPDAVRVTLHRTVENDNPVPANLLRIMGLQSWDVTVYAVAQRFIPDCLTDGLLARGLVDISSNNGFSGDMCVHGQQGVSMQNHNDFAPGVRVTMPNPEVQLDIPRVGMTSNPGLPQALGADILDPRMVNHVDEIMDDLLTMEAYVTPGYIDTNLPVIEKPWNWNFADAVAGRVYNIVCASNKHAGIPGGAVLAEMVIVADCQLGIGAGALLTDVVLASRSGPGNGANGISNANISFSADVTLGAPDGCIPGGGVQIFSNASVHFSSSMTLNGVQIVVAGDVELGARDQGINGINVQAGGDITLTSNNAFGLCTGGAPGLFTVDYYRLVF